MDEVALELLLIAVRFALVDVFVIERPDERVHRLTVHTTLPVSFYEPIKHDLDLAVVHALFATVLFDRDFLQLARVDTDADDEFGIVIDALVGLHFNVYVLPVRLDAFGVHLVKAIILLLDQPVRDEFVQFIDREYAVICDAFLYQNVLHLDHSFHLKVEQLPYALRKRFDLIFMIISPFPKHLLSINVRQVEPKKRLGPSFLPIKFYRT